MITSQHGGVVVVGAGPGGYAAAFRSADLGKKVILIDKDAALGGVCLNRGCIPSKALLHLAKIIDDTKSIKKCGVSFKHPEFDLDQIRKWKKSVINQLNIGIQQLAKARNIKVLNGWARFTSEKVLSVETDHATQNISFEHCILATGSKASPIPCFPDKHPRIIYSSEALDLPEIPKRMLIIGGGYIGLELGTVYHALGSSVSVVEFLPTILPGADEDLVQPLFKILNKKFNQIYLSTKVTKMDPTEKEVSVFFEKADGTTFCENFDMVLVAVGRQPNTKELNLDKAYLTVNKKGFITVNEKCQTSQPNIYAIGDITGNPMLAHKATHEGKTAAEVISDLPATFTPAVIPAVIFTDPEIAWAGPTESELKEKGIEYAKGEFPWMASGRAIAIGRTEGKTKLLFNPENKKIISAGIVGPNAGDLIGEAILAIEMGADVEDISLSIHPHPTLTETFSNAAEMFAGTITDLYSPK